MSRKATKTTYKAIVNGKEYYGTLDELEEKTFYSKGALAHCICMPSKNLKVERYYVKSYSLYDLTTGELIDKGLSYPDLQKFLGVSYNGVCQTIRRGHNQRMNVKVVLE